MTKPPADGTYRQFHPIDHAEGRCDCTSVKPYQCVDCQQVVYLWSDDGWAHYAPGVRCGGMLRSVASDKAS
jgi:hypothetical protein